MRVIVSFTSYPARIGSVHKVVDSLCRQTMKADEVILYLSTEDFEGGENDIPIELRKRMGHNGFKVSWVQGNLKSHKKYYYVLQEYKEDVVITVDDDTLYAETLISDLLRSYRKFPHAVSARRIRIILKKEKGLEQYSKWECEKYIEECRDLPRMDLCAIGVGGVCYPPGLVNDRWFDDKIILKLAENQDDLWLKYNEIMNNIPTVYVEPSQEDVILKDLQQCSLSIDNLYGNENDRCINNLMMLLKKTDKDIYNKWMHSLLNHEEYIMQKKCYYRNIFNIAIDGVGNVPVYLYGAGKIAKHILSILSELGLTQRISSIVVSSASNNPSKLYGLPVSRLNNIDKKTKFGVIFGVSDENKIEIENNLKDYDYQCINLDLKVIERYC